MGTIKVLNIIQDSIVDGKGLRTVIFFAGCTHRCKGCHNPESWNINYGTDYTVEEIVKQVQLNPISKGVTLSGGDPMLQASEIIPLVRKLKRLNYNLWIYTGYTFEEIVEDEVKLELLSLCDILVDGKFVKELKDPSLNFRGSSNQRIINIKEELHDRGYNKP